MRIPWISSPAWPPRERGLAAWLFLIVGLQVLLSSSVRGDLGSRLMPLLKSHPGVVAVAVKHLRTGEQFTFRADEPMPTASLIKVAVMAEAYRQAQEGRLDLSRTLTLREEDKVPGSGILTAHFSAGAQLSVRDAIRLMIVYSDNTATNLVIDQVGLPATTTTMEGWGLKHTKLHAKVYRGDTSLAPERSRQFGLGSTTAAEMVRLLEMIGQRQIVSAEACDQMLDHLRHCDDDSMIARSLPASAHFAHKTGAVAAVRTDAGIMETPGGAIAICILTRDNEDRRWAPDNAAQILCADIGRLTYDYFDPPRVAAPAPLDAPLRKGVVSPLVEALQRTLNARLVPSPDLHADGDFGPMTEQAVIRFQKEHHLEPNGVVAKETWAALSPLVTDASPVPTPEEVNAQLLSREPPDNLSGPPFVTCKAWAVADAETGKVIWSHRPDDRLPIASTTKIMTAYVILKTAQQDPGLLDEELTISDLADLTIGTTADLRAGEKLKVREALFALLLPSGNDAAIALAEHCGPRFPATQHESDEAEPVARFVAQMNREAVRLEMKETQFRNSHGLSAEGHYSSAADLVRLTCAARQLPAFRDYVNTRQHGATVESVVGYRRNLVWKNSNRLLAIEGYKGVKTGTTDAAGACLVSLGEHDHRELLVVVLGASSSEARYTDTRNLFRWAWNQPNPDRPVVAQPR